MVGKNDVLRVCVIAPGSAERVDTLGFARCPDAEVVAAADTYEASLECFRECSSRTG